MRSKCSEFLFFAGIDRALVSGERFVFTDDFETTDDGILLFSNVFGPFPLPESDRNLFVEKGAQRISDDFCHEQNMMVSSGGRSVLFCGCAHAEIVNIVRKAKTLTGDAPAAVVGGFHLYEPTRRRYEKNGYIDDAAAALAEEDTFYYGCHCTGAKACERMKLRLGTRLISLHTGSEIFL